ncbi:hypothetical protein N0Z91_20945, partial [Acinetobacter baumannii]|uniref:hypothetical protein n=1 Tax=Acinetobacter baumannii TaxID=470 RepID=UPI00241EB9F6
PLLTEVDGKARFSKIADGVTAKSKTDDATGMTTVVILPVTARPASGKDLRPGIVLDTTDGGEQFYFLPQNTIVTVR